MNCKIISGQFFLPLTEDFIHQVTLGSEQTDDRIILNAHIHGDEERSKKLVQTIEAEFQTRFFSSTEDIYDRFEESLKNINDHIEEHSLAEGLETHISIAALSEENLYLTQSGDAEVYLIRGQQLTVVSEGLSEKESDDLFVNIANGKTRDDDKILLTSKRLLRNMTSNQIVQLFSEGVAESIESLKSQLETEIEEIQGVGVMALHLKEIKPIASSHEKIFHPQKKRGIQAFPQNILPFFEAFSQKAQQFFQYCTEFFTKKTGLPKDKIQKNLLAISILFGVIFLIFIVSRLSVDTEKKEKFAEYKSAIQQIDSDLQTAEARAFMDDPDAANAILLKVETKAQEILETGMFRSESIAILERVQKSKDSINNITRIQSANTVFADLSTSLPEDSLQGLAELENTFFPYTSTRLFETVINEVSSPVKLHESEKVVASSTMPDKDAIYFYTEGGKILEYKDNIVSAVTTEDAQWKNTTVIRSFSRYLYFLDLTENSIWKYERKRDGFGPATAWTQSGATITDSIDFSIDGYIFLLKKGGDIQKFYRGELEEFGPTRMPNEILSTATKIFTQQDQTRLYLLDPTNSRVIITTKGAKEARYKRQIVIEGSGPLVDLYVDKPEQKLYLLDEKKIYQIDLKDKGNETPFS